MIYEKRKEAEGVWRSIYEDDYDFARLFIGTEYLPPTEEALLFAPSQSVLLATNRTDPETIERICALGSDLANEHRPLSQLLWRCRDGVITEWVPETNDPAYPLFELQQLQDRMSQYEDQKQLLEVTLSEQGEDSFVAAYCAYKNDAGIQSYCTYTFDLPSYLPLCEEVFLCDPNQGKQGDIVGKLSWADFCDLMGDAMNPLVDYAPERFRILESLSAETRQALISRAQPI